MSWSIQERGSNRFQLRVTHGLLPKPFFYTFEDRPQAESYRDRLLSMLAQGVVPQALLTKEAKGNDPLIVEVVSAYEQRATVTDSDLALLKLVRSEVAGLRMSQLSYEWVEAWVKRMKLEANRSPGTIRKRVGVLARAVDWHFKSTTPQGQTLPANPLRLLPDGYSQYTTAETAALEAKGKGARVDVERDRRLSPEEEGRCRAALAGEKRPDRERALAVDPEFTALFELIVDTGLRLSEGFKLRVEKVDLARGVLRLDGSKAARGQRKPRVVPLKRHLRELLADLIGSRTSGLLFSFWDGVEDQKKASRRLTGRFGTLFAYAGVADFTEHDLRHEATCRWFELRRPDGAWVFSEIEICKLMGWTSTKLALRYASLRGEDLADRLL